MKSSLGGIACQLTLWVCASSWLLACANDVIVGGHDPNAAQDADADAAPSSPQSRPLEDEADTRDEEKVDDDRREEDDKPFPMDDFTGPGSTDDDFRSEDDFDGPFPDRDRPIDDGFGGGPQFDEFSDAGLRLPGIEPPHLDEDFADDTFTDEDFADDTFTDEGFADDAFADDAFGGRDEPGELPDRDEVQDPDDAEREGGLEDAGDAGPFDFGGQQ